MPNKKKSEPIQRFSISDELWERLEPLLLETSPRREVARWTTSPRSTCGGRRDLLRPADRLSVERAFDEDPRLLR